MLKNIIPKFRKIYKYLLSISIVLAAISLMVGCASIFFSGKGYSREIVALTFSKISVFIYVCIALVIVDIIWELLSPSNISAKKITKKNNATKKVNFNLTNIIILVIAIVLIIVGAILGGYLDVLTKAINICTECIGLG